MSPFPFPLRRHRLLGLLAWLLPACGLLALALTWCLLLSTLQVEQARARDAAQQQARTLGKAFEAHTRGALRQLDQTARFVAHIVHEHGGRGVDLEALVRQTGQAVPGMIGVHVADRHGVVMSSTLSGPVVNIADREHFRVHVDGKFGGLFVSKPVLGRLSGRWSIQMTRRIEAADGRFLGVVIVSADPAYFTNFYALQQFGRHGQLSFVGLDGVVRGRRIGDQVWFDAASSVRELPAALRAAPQGLLQDVSPVDGRRRWLAYAQLEGYPFVVLAGLDEREALQAHEAHRRTMLRVLGAASVVGLLLLSGLGWLLTLAGRRQREIEEANRAVARAEQRIRTIADSVPALVAYVDRDGRYQFTNAYYRSMYGADPTSFIGRPVREVLGEAAYGELQPHIEAVMAGEPRRFERHAREHGLDIHLLSNYEPDRDEQGRVVGFHVMSLDITERKRAEMRQAQSERRLRLIADNVPALISHLDAHGRYLYANQQFQRLLGIEPDRLAGQPLAQVRDAAYVAQVTSAMQTVLDGQEVSFETQLVLNGTMHHFQQNYVPDVDAQGRVAGFYSITFDVTHLKDVERRLSAMARTDPLTGLPNRLHFHEKIREAQARQRRSLAGLALLYLDVDRFKRINDVHGHAMGDAVLKEFARRLRAGVRETDTVARLAGDEFVVILEGVLRAGDACEVANKVLANFDPLFELDGESLSVSPSIGIVVDESGSMEPDELLAAADDALYQAKRLGRRRARLWQPAVEAVDG